MWRRGGSLGTAGKQGVARERAQPRESGDGASPLPGASGQIVASLVGGWRRLGGLGILLFFSAFSLDPVCIGPVVLRIIF
jgi:hypothetical protein